MSKATLLIKAGGGLLMGLGYGVGKVFGEEIGEGLYEAGKALWEDETGADDGVETEADDTVHED